MVYYKFGITVNKKQAKRLLEGEGIKLTHAELKGPHATYLTKPQLLKLERAFKTGKGTSLKLSPSQLKYNVINGSGIFDSLKALGKKGLSAGIKALAPVAANALANVITGQADKLADKIDPQDQSGTGFWGDLGDVFTQQLLPAAIGIGARKLGGMGLKPRGRPKRGNGLNLP